MVDQAIQPASAPGPRRQHLMFEPLGEDASTAGHSLAPKPADGRDQLYGPPGHRQIDNAPAITAMDAAALGTTAPVLWTSTIVASAVDEALVTAKPGGTRDERRSGLCILGSWMTRNAASQLANFIKTESEPNLHADKGSMFRAD
jgi:hypothetical protein